MRCKGVHCVDLAESFPTSIYSQTSASIQPRTSPVKFARSPCTDPPGLRRLRELLAFSSKQHSKRSKHKHKRSKHKQQLAQQAQQASAARSNRSPASPGLRLSSKVRSARDRTIRTFHIRNRSKILESKGNHEKHRREKNHFNEAAFDPKYKKGPHERREKGNKLH